MAGRKRRKGSATWEQRKPIPRPARAPQPRTQAKTPERTWRRRGGEEYETERPVMQRVDLEALLDFASQQPSRGQQVRNVRTIDLPGGGVAIVGHVLDDRRRRVEIRGYEIWKDGLRYFYWGLRAVIDGFIPSVAFDTHYTSGTRPPDESFVMVWEDETAAAERQGLEQEERENQEREKREQNREREKREREKKAEEKKERAKKAREKREREKRALEKKRAEERRRRSIAAKKAWRARRERERLEFERRSRAAKKGWASRNRKRRP